jgi:hypothetical protein
MHRISVLRRAVLVCFLVYFCRTVRADSVGVDFSLSRGPMQYRGSGFLHSFDNTVPDSLIAPLKPRLLRDRPDGANGSGAFGNYSRAQSLGAAMQIVLSDGYNNYQAPWPGGANGDDWAPWENYVTNTVLRATTSNAKFQYDIWNEPDIGYFWAPDPAQYLETWKRGVQRIRLLDPTATIVGPSISSYGSTRLSVKDFLTYAKTNNVLPDVLSWHEFSGAFGTRVDDVRQFMTANGINIPRISLNEIISASDMAKPGILPRYFGQLERYNIESSTHACWLEPDGTDNCDNGSLNGLLTPTKQKRATWWTYERYAKMVGTAATATNGSTVDAVASYENGAAYVLVGRFRSSSDTSADLLLENLDDIANLVLGGQVHVLAERIADSGFNASSGPVTMLDGIYSVTNGQLLLTLPNFSSYDSYFVTLTATVPEPLALLPLLGGLALLRRRRRRVA